jgi:hypothetical protein
MSIYQKRELNTEQTMPLKHRNKKLRIFHKWLHHIIS